MSSIAIQPESESVGAWGARVERIAWIVGGGGLAVAVGLGLWQADHLRRFLQTYLVSYCFFLSLSLGALFFVALQHLTRAGWSVTVRRIAELLAANVQPMLILFLPILASVLMGDGGLYKWSDVEVAAGDALIRGKTAYLNSSFFVIRCLIYFAGWALLARFFLGRSLTQDRTHDKQLTLRMQSVSAPTMLVLALTITFAAFDWLMSLDAHWFSTIFGVYFFSGCVVAFFALMIVIAATLQRQGKLERQITTEHYHDLGKLLFGFIMFWAYIAFSQYLLIWYANIPEETAWFKVRQENGWQWVSLALLFGHFILPFLGLMSRHVRRNRATLCGWAVFILAMHWVDLYWLVMPTFQASHPGFGVIDLACFLGLGGLYTACVLRRAASCSLIPVGDPRLAESIAFKNH